MKVLYGPDFAGRIEVHHIIPLNEIREDYGVDPITDLLPVCSNCHAALHSKKDGVYTPEKLKATVSPPKKQTSVNNDLHVLTARPHGT
ncbi:MAG: HNH endonuclease [Lachnospiraceae bacterium]|nr:HNH endonuclease [Lachnospiraceae bacterium]